MTATGKKRAGLQTNKQAVSKSGSRVSEEILAVGGYELLNLLGEGSFGVVYLCRHMKEKYMACAKLENLQTTTAQVVYEYRLYRKLARTPAASFVPKAYRQGEAGDFRFMILELGGKDLSTIVDTHSEAEKMLIFRNLLSALRAIHDGGVVHRDIKPKNILLKPGSRTDVFVVDLGLAKICRSGLKHIPNRNKTSIAGTSRYASVPSQMCTQTSRRDDMYSLCYTMLVLFGRTLPWQNLKNDKKKKLLETVRLKRILSPSEVCRGCPDPIRIIYTMVMQLGFSQRPEYEAYQKVIDKHVQSLAKRRYKILNAGEPRKK